MMDPGVDCVVLLGFGCPSPAGAEPICIILRQVLGYVASCTWSTHIDRMH